MDLTEGSIAKRLIRFTIPIILLNILNQAYVIVDNVIIARCVNEHALSVISAADSVLVLGYCLLQGAGSAANILVGRLFGAKKYNELKKTAFTLFMGGLVFSAVLGLVYIVGRRPFLVATQVPGALLNESSFLIIIYAVSFIPTLISSVCAYILYGMGDSTRPTIIAVISQLINIVLDLVVIKCWGMGVNGAAYASLFSVTVSMIWQLSLVMRKLHGYRESHYAFSGDIFGRYSKLALPSMLQQTVMALGNILIQVLINRAGESYINGNTVASTLNNLMIIPIISICSGYETFAAQNLGAKKHDRVKKGFRDILLVGLACCLILAAVSYFAANGLVSLYLKDPDSTSFGFARTFLVLLIPNYFLLLAKYSVESVFKANLRVSLFTISSLIALAVRVALSWVCAEPFGLLSLAMATAIGNLVAAAFNWGLLARRHYL